jgi:hypothetical protein
MSTNSNQIRVSDYRDQMPKMYVEQKPFNLPALLVGLMGTVFAAVFVAALITAAVFVWAVLQ